MGNKILSRLPSSLKVLATAFVLAVGIGYAVSVVQIINRTGVKTRQTIQHYRGIPGDEIAIPQSPNTLLSVAHVHTFSQPLVIGLMGLLFALSAVSERTKIVWILVSFLGSLASNAGPWLVRYVSPGAVFLLYVAGGALFLSFLVMAGTVLRDLWRSKGEAV